MFPNREDSPWVLDGIQKNKMYRYLIMTGRWIYDDLWDDYWDEQFHDQWRRDVTGMMGIKKGHNLQMAWFSYFQVSTYYLQFSQQTIEWIRFMWIN